MVPGSNCVLVVEEGKAAAAAEADEVPAGVPDFWMVAIRNALEEDAVRPHFLFCFDLKCFQWRPFATRWRRTRCASLLGFCFIYFWMVAIRNALEEDAVRLCLLVCFDLNCFRWRPFATH